MRNLPLPSRDTSRSDLETVLKEYKYKKQTKGYAASPEEIDAILELYDEYDEGPAVPSDALRGATLADALVEAIHAAFGQTQKKRKLKHIRSAAFKNVPQCPVCGIDPPVELDHFLPQSAFKPLSIYVRNLVPLCHACNDDKRALHAEDDANFVHAYFDELPDVQFLKAEVSIEGGGLVVDFSIEAVDGLDAGLRKRLADQMDKLRLNDRYADEITLFALGHTVALYTSFDTGGAGEVKRYLRRQSRVERGALYRNHWRPVLLQALSEHDDFCDGGFRMVLPIPPELLDAMAGELEDA